jgi:hypothetical protein
LLLALAFAQDVPAAEYRTFDGTSNNINNPTWGANNGMFLHPIDQNQQFFYEDGISEPRGGGFNTPAQLPNERAVRDAIIYGQGVPDPAPSSDWAWVVGEYLAFEVVHTVANTSETWNIPIPNTDQYYSQHNGSISFGRCVFQAGTGTSAANPRVQSNGVTAYIDGSSVYGENNATAYFIRNFTGGLLNYVQGPDGEIPPNYGPAPYPAGVVPANNAQNVPTSQLFALGSPRVNQQPQSMCLNILWRREHNRQARSLAQSNPTWNDELLYQEARRRVVALMEHFYETEYMPMLLGTPNLDPYAGYNASQNADVNMMFNQVALRYGHTQVNNITWRRENDGTPSSGGDILLRDVFFDPTLVQTYGCSSIYYGLNLKAHNSPEVNIVDDLKEFVFAHKGSYGIDLISTNMRRARDVGLPAFNDARMLYGLAPYSDWSFTDWSFQFQNVYNTSTPDTCDPWICGILENPTPPGLVGGELGELLYHVVKKQFEAFRDGDRFWYLNNQFSPADLAEIQGTKLSHIILRNSQVAQIKCDIFEVPGNPYTGTVGPDCTQQQYATTAASTTGSTTGSSASSITFSAVALMVAIIAALMF